MTADQVIQLAELGAYLALRLRRHSEVDSEVIAQIKALIADAATPQEAIDRLLAKVQENEDALDQKIGSLPE
jgi:hypothetical protein